jgi:hypothetical protein
MPAADLAALESFVGEWIVHASIGPPEAVGRARFEWALGGAYLLERSEAPDPAPDGLCVIAPAADGAGYTQHYFDSRGVVRLYAMTFADGEWTLLRTEPDFSPLDFSQRYTGTFSPDGDVIEGRWETSDDLGATWTLDFELDYRRA